MKQTAPISLDSFDPEVLAAAREVARRAGVPLESWIASVAAPEPSKPAPRRRRTDATAQAAKEAVKPKDIAKGSAKSLAKDPGRQSGGETADKAGAPAAYETSSPQKHREPSPAAPTTNAAPSTTATPALLEASLGAMMRRLDALDRSISEEREAARTDAVRMLGEIEARLSAARPPAAAEAMAERFTEIERKMGEIAGQLGAPRPLGRRGRPLATEVRDAVAEVRRRQRELEEGVAAWHAPAVTEPRALAADAAQDHAVDGRAPSPAVAELQRETSRLRDTLGSLATGRDVGELERTMRTVASDLQRARDPRDVAAMAAPVELMRVQVERLAEDMTGGVHTRVAGEVERLAAKVDGALSGVSAGQADQGALDTVLRELDEIRRLVAALAGPERIQSLAQGVQAISAQIAQLQRGEDAEAAALKPLLEQIRSELRAPAESRELIGRLETLAEKVDRVSAGGSGLDALERHVLALARRLDAPRGTDPALTRLERSMGDLLSQVSALHGGSGLEAAVERATEPLRSVGGEVGLLRADLAELRASQKTSDQRLQATMEGVHAVLTRLSEQLDRTMTSSAALNLAAPQERAAADALLSERSLGERPLGERSLGERSSGERRPHERPAAPKAAAPRAPAPPLGRPRLGQSDETAGIEADRFSDELLEPGAGRPEPGRPAPAETGAATGTDIKTSFIAAARRAAQAAQAEATAEAPVTARPRERMSAIAAAGRATGGTASAAPITETGPVSWVRGMFESRRRTLLLGLAAVVLALGAYQAFVAGSDAPTGDVAASDARPAGTAPETAANRTAEAKTEAKAETAQPAPSPSQADAHATPPDPVTTQSLAETKPPAGKAGEAGRALPKVASMNTLGPDLAALPPALNTLKQEALDGDGAAVWELATRMAEGRGMPRELGLAAKLYERLAGAGFAPAQVKIGNAYEKGSGVIRDIAQAKVWYGRAAAQGNVRAMHNIAVLQAENPAANGKPDFAAAASAFRRAAEHGVRDSQYNLAVLYARGLGVGQDLVQSYLWFSAAAAQGDEEAGRKRDEVATKLAPKDLAEAKGLAASFKPKAVDAAANEAPPAKSATTPPMSLMGAPSPGLPNPNAFQKRVGV